MCKFCSKWGVGRCLTHGYTLCAMHRQHHVGDNCDYRRWEEYDK